MTNFESVEKYALVLESELEDLVTTSRSLVTPKVKSVKGNPKGKNGKDGKGEKGKNGKDGKGKVKAEACFSSQIPKMVARTDNSAQGITGC